MRTRTASAVVGCTLATLLAGGGTALAKDGNLPGGTSIANAITAPAGGTTFQAPATFDLTGTASVGQGAVRADTSLIYVVDVSGSTGDAAGCGGNPNGGTANTVLDCEIAATKALNQAAIDAGTVDEVGLISFQSTATTVRGLTSPSDPAIQTGLNSLTSNGGTSFEAATRAACTMAQGSTNPNTVVVFLSDGLGTGNALDDLPCSPATATFQTFAIGSGSSCTVAVGGGSTLGAIAQATGGTCTKVTDPATLSSLVPGVVDAQLERLELSVDGGAPVDISAGASASLPRTGPASVTYERAISGLPVGTHTLCTTAFGSDVGGDGSVEDCISVEIVAPPRASIDDVTVTEGDSGTTPATFTVALDKPSAGPVSLSYATGDGSATAPADYAAATGTVTFAPGETSKPVTVTVESDLIDEPTETFHARLSNPGGATIADGDGLGRILDDDRSGAFTCRAAGLRALGLELSVSNRPNDPCADDDAAVATLNLGALGQIRAGAKVIDTSTALTPDDLVATNPALDDRGEADARVSTVTVVAGLSIIRADVVTSHAEARCTGPLGTTPRLTGISQIANLTVNGLRARVDADGTVDLLLGRLHVNSTRKTATGVTQRALWFENTVLSSSLDVVVGEAKAGFTGNPCA